MSKFLKILILTILTGVLSFSCNLKTDNKAIAHLYSKNHNLKFTYKIKNLSAGEKYIQFYFTNQGKETDYLDSVEICLKTDIEVTEKYKLINGGSSWGKSTFILANPNNKNSKSATFQMLSDSKSNFILTGILTWNKFIPYISYDYKKGIIIKADGEGKSIAPGETIEFEKILIEKNTSWQDLMFNYGKRIADVHQIMNKKPTEIKGWATWNYYGEFFNTKDIFKNIDQLRIDQKDANMIQIDGGWWTARGDYISAREDLQGGMKVIAAYAKSKGFTAGIHLDGFRADKNSEIYRNHPDWFLKDQDGETICMNLKKGEDHSQIIYLDYSNPKVCAYMENIIRTIHQNWGYNYFKINFIRFGSLETIKAEHRLNQSANSKQITKINAFDNSLTSTERTRAGLKAMRKGMGNAFFLVSTSTFGPALGIVDGLRTGEDISSNFNNYETRSLQNAGNFYLNGTVVQNVADYLVVRSKQNEEAEFDLGNKKSNVSTTYEEAKMWSDYIALYGGVKLNSDNLLTLNDERKKLIKNAFNFKPAKRFIPLDLLEHANNNNDAYNIMLAENEDGVYLSLFNWDNQTKQFSLSGIKNLKLINTENKKQYPLVSGRVKIDLKRHQSTIIKLEGGNFDELRKSIVVFN